MTRNILDKNAPYKKYEHMLKFFKLEDMVRIEAMAASMSRPEIFDYYMIDEELGKDELFVIDKAVSRGRSRAIHDASDNLFKQMKDSKGGAAACLSYLKRYASGYQGEVDDSEGKEGFTYNLNINVDADKGNKIQEQKEANGNVVPLKSV